MVSVVFANYAFYRNGKCPDIPNATWENRDDQPMGGSSLAVHDYWIIPVNGSNEDINVEKSFKNLVKTYIPSHNPSFTCSLDNRGYMDYCISSRGVTFDLRNGIPDRSGSITKDYTLTSLYTEHIPESGFASCKNKLKTTYNFSKLNKTHLYIERNKHPVDVTVSSPKPQF